jgi:hypothetical protein
MKDGRKTKKQPVEELTGLRQQVAELETLVLGPWSFGPRTKGDKYRATDTERVREHVFDTLNSE